MLPGKVKLTIGIKFRVQFNIKLKLNAKSKVKLYISLIDFVAKSFVIPIDASDDSAKAAYVKISKQRTKSSILFGGDNLLIFRR